jgi:hypothetical protein
MGAAAGAGAAATGAGGAEAAGGCVLLQAARLAMASARLVASKGERNGIGISLADETVEPLK